MSAGADYWGDHLHRAGGDGRSERVNSARQRTVVLTFATPEEADKWDELGDIRALALIAECLRRATP